MKELKNLNPGIVEKWMAELPEKAFHLGIRVILAALTLLIGIQVIRLLRHLIRRGMKRGKADDNVIGFMDSFVKYGLYLLLIFLIASGLGVDAAGIIALLGSAGVAIGLALQGSLSNLAGGILLMMLKPFQPGDYIMDGQEHAGFVEKIDIFCTYLITPDNKSIVLPNGVLANGSITNYTKLGKRRVDVFVGIPYEADLKKAKEVLRQTLENNEKVLAGEEKTVFVDSFGESAVLLGLRFFTGCENYWPAKWEITEAVKYALEEAGITIPYRQVDIHFDKNLDLSK